jgi:hypothetical protein
MKNILKTNIVIAAMLTSTLAYSNDYITMRPDSKSPITEISFDNVNEASSLIIKDSNNYILYSYQINKSGKWSKAFDFTGLPDGDYIIELEKQAEIVITPLEVRSNVAKVLKKEEYKIAKPQITLKDDYVYVSKMSMDRVSTKIEIFFEGYDLAYSEILKDSNSLNRVYDFSDCLEGNYLFLIKSEGRTFSDNIYIESQL